MPLDLIRMIIQYGPTILFVSLIFFGVLIGFIRGYHKSKIMFLHSLFIGLFTFGTYFILMNLSSFDNLLVKGINLLFGEGFIQNMMGVSLECESFTQILTELIPHYINYGDALYLILKDNGMYLGALVNFVYHIIFFIIFLILYIIIKLIVSFVYGLSYREKRYHKKLNLKFAEGKSDYSYSPLRWKGALIGFVRGFIASIISLSMLGSCLYSVTGGIGKNDLDDFNFKDETLNNYVSLFKEIDSYGSSGIFKVLNSVKDNKDVPLYLYLTDLVFRGDYKGEEGNISLSLRNELSSLTSFSKDCLVLLNQYCKDDFEGLISGKFSNDEMMNKLAIIFEDPSFRRDLADLFYEFDSETYMLNFTLSFVDSLVTHFDIIEQAMPQNQYLDLVKILFVKGYKSEIIPYERLSNDNEIFPYIKPSNLIKKTDLTPILNLALSAFTQYETNEDFYKSVISNLRQLTLFSTSRKDEINPVLGRIFAYIEASLLSDINAPITNVSSEDLPYYHDFLYYKDVDWVYEILSLVDNMSNIEILSNNLTQSNDLFEGFITLFDRDNANYKENMQAYKSIKRYLTNSKLIDRLFNTPYANLSIRNALEGLVVGINLPKTINYLDYVDENGNKKPGELSSILNLFEFFARKNNISLFEELFNSPTINMDSILELINRLYISVDDNNIRYLTYLKESDVFRSFVSATLINNASEYIYVPSSCLDDDNNIKKEYLNHLYDNFRTIMQLVTPLLNNPNDLTNIDNIISDPRIPSLIKNPIIEGTIANNIISYCNGNDFIKLTKKLQEVDGWISKNEDGEILKILNSFKILNIKLSDLINGNINADELLNRIQNLDETEIDQFLDSELLLSSVSSFLLNEANFGQNKVIIPNSCLYNGEYIIKKEIITLFNSLKVIPFDLFQSGNVNELLKVLVNNRSVLLESDILTSTIAYNIQYSLPSDFIITDTLKNDGTIENLKIYSKNNKWRKEIPAILDIIECFFIDYNGNVNLDFNYLQNLVLTRFDQPSIIDTNKTNLDVINSSIMVMSNVTKFIDDSLRQIIDQSIKPCWYDANKNLRLSDIKAILNLIKDLGITDFNNIDFNNIRFNNPTIRESISNSVLIRAVITSMVKQNLPLNINIPDAAFDRNNIFKTDEILSLVTLLGDSTIQSFDINNINLSRTKTLFEKSMILSSAITTTIKGLDSVVLPRSCYKNNLIIHTELTKLVESLEIVTGKIDNLYISDININNLRLDSPNIKQIIQSDILNATIVSNLTTYYGVLTNSVKEHLTTGFKNNYDINNNQILLFTEGEFDSLIKGINSIGSFSADGKSFDIDILKIATLLGDNARIKELLKSSIIHIYINDKIIDYVKYLPGYSNNIERMNTYELSSGRRVIKNVLSIDFIVDNFEIILQLIKI